MLGGVALDVTTRLMDGDVMSAALLSSTVHNFYHFFSLSFDSLFFFGTEKESTKSAAK